MKATDKRLIEDAIPVDVISRTSASEKVGGRIGHPNSLHLWWARRPLAASRAAVYAALVSASGRQRSPEEEADFFERLTAWGGPVTAIEIAKAEILDANGGDPPKVVDPFAGGGAIPLEAARLGCDVTANELNPVAHLIERMMLEFPQAHHGLADDVLKWGNIWIDRAWDQVSDVYPVVPGGGQQVLGRGDEGRRPLAYLWTRTVLCPNPALSEHRVDLVRQTWLGKKAGRMAALRPVVNREELRVSYEVVTAPTAAAMGFDPGAGSTRGQTTCRLCGATVTVEYVKAEGRAGRMGVAPLCAVVLASSGRGREYLPVGGYELPDDDECRRRLEELSVQPPDEELVSNYNQAILVPSYGLRRFRDLFTARQLLTLCTLASGIKEIHEAAVAGGMEPGRAAGVATALGITMGKVVDYNSALCTWHNGANAELVNHVFSKQAMPMVWDFAEAGPFANSAGDVRRYLTETANLIERLAVGRPATCIRGSATSLPLAPESQDAVITDPPYYDNISYADLADYFYVWLKRSVGFLYPEDFSGELTPKRNEAVSVLHRHGGDRVAATTFYEDMMSRAFLEAHRVLKPGGIMVCVYAHKTTIGWSTLVDALRASGFVVTEAWPLDTEMPERSRGQGAAALASSIFLVARKRDASARVGDEEEVMRELDEIISERLGRLGALGVTGSDLVIATVGAGLRALTRHARVEQANGELLPAERFLTTVQSRVLDAIFGSLVGVDPVTRFYVAAQYSYGYAAVPFDEANNLARVTGVDLDGPQGLTSPRMHLVKKTGSTVALIDFEDRGGDEDLGFPSESRGAASLIDIAHGVLWRAEHRPADLRAYLMATTPDTDRLRQVVQALAGKALRSGTSEDAKPREAATAERLLVSWRRLIDDNYLL